MKKILYPLIVALLIVALVSVMQVACSRTSKIANAIDSDTIVAAVENVVADDNASEQTATQGWQYDQSQDEMTDKMTYFASITSTNMVDFDFPYDGGSYLTLTIRKSPKYGLDVYISISNGQFIAGVEGEPVYIRFDKNKEFKVIGMMPDDDSSTTLFLSNPRRLIEDLKKSSTMKIQVEFYQSGNQVFDFDVSGLKWDH